MKEFRVHLTNGEVKTVFVPGRSDVLTEVEANDGIQRHEVTRIQDCGSVAELEKFLKAA